MAAVEAFLKEMEASLCGLLDTNNYTIRGCFYLDDLDKLGIVILIKIYKIKSRSKESRMQVNNYTKT